MSRAHVFGFDTNAAQFDRMGNPWVSERDRAEFSAPNRKQTRENLRSRLLGNFPDPERRPERSSRADSPAMARIVKSGKFINAFKACADGSRTVLAIDPPAEPPVVRIAPQASRELNPWDVDQIEHQRERLAREHQQAVAEAKRLRAEREVAVWAGFEQAMEKAIVS